MASDELAFLTIREQAELIRGRKLSPVELTRSYLDRAERVNDRLHAYITICRDEALAAAREAEAELARGQDRGPLHGIPVAVKDQMQIAGVRTTGGSRLFADWVPQDDSTIVAHFRKAGAVLLGTLNTMEFHMGTTINWPFGMPRNPWDPERTPGGSSSGSGIAVAAGLCGAAVGEDTGGSIRSPASFCGIAGFKPTWSRISRYGVFPLCWPMDCAGPMARSAEDCAIVLRCLAGHDPKDPTSSKEPVPDYRAQLSGDLRGLRVGVVEEMVDASVSKEAREAAERAVDVLRGLGVTVQRVSLPLMQYGRPVHTAVVDTEAASYHRPRLLTRYQDYDYNTRVRLMVGAALPSGMQTLATRLRAAIGQQVLDAFKSYDILLGATSEGGAGKVQTETGIHSKADALTKLFGRPGVGAQTTAFNMAGTPAISVPCGFNAEGMPLGFHIAGGLFQEGLVLKVAHGYQQATDWHRKHPALN